MTERMSKVTVKFYSPPREKVKRSELSLAAHDIGEVLETLRHRMGVNMAKELFEHDGSLGRHYVFLLNGQIMNARELRNIKSKEGDILDIFPVIAGG